MFSKAISLGLRSQRPISRLLLLAYRANGLSAAHSPPNIREVRRRNGVFYETKCSSGLDDVISADEGVVFGREFCHMLSSTVWLMGVRGRRGMARKCLSSGENELGEQLIVSAQILDSQTAIQLATRSAERDDPT